MGPQLLPLHSMGLGPKRDSGNQEGRVKRLEVQGRLDQLCPAPFLGMEFRNFASGGVGATQKEARNKRGLIRPRSGTAGLGE